MCLLYSSSAFAKGNFGAGVVIGNPTGLTAKYVFSKIEAVDATLSFWGDDNFYLHSTWLLLRSRLFAIDKYPVRWYFGVGARVFNHDHGHRHGHHGHDELHLGVRVPLGLRMNFRDPKIELYTELSFAVDITPETDFDLGFGLGARYYF